MSLKELLVKNRSYRRFLEKEPIEEAVLKQLVELTRYCPSAANRQPLKYVLCCTPEQNARIFPHLSWASELPQWKGPAKGERPPAYILMLADKDIAPHTNCDHGIAAQTILLGAAEVGLGGCMVGAVNRRALSRELKLPERFEVLMVIALGKPAETVVVDDSKSPDQTAYWRDDEGVHHVPKRSLEELIVQPGNATEATAEDSTD